MFLQQEGKILIDWFSFNCMQANPGKFQAIAVGKKTFGKSPVFSFDTVNITCEEVVKLGCDYMSVPYHTVPCRGKIQYRTVRGISEFTEECR